MAPLTVSLVLYRPEPALLRATLAALEVACQALGAEFLLDPTTATLQLRLALDSPAPVRADADGKYAVPRPGVENRREY